MLFRSVILGRRTWSSTGTHLYSQEEFRKISPTTFFHHSGRYIELKSRILSPVPQSKSSKKIQIRFMKPMVWIRSGFGIRASEYILHETPANFRYVQEKPRFILMFLPVPGTTPAFKSAFFHATYFGRG